MILLSGDFHGNSCGEIQALSNKKINAACDRAGIEVHDIKYHIILGDCGFFFPGIKNIKNDLYNIEFFNSKPFVTLCLLGNHDNYDALDKLDDADIGIGEIVKKVSEKIYYLPRGKRYDIDGKKLLVLGGGLSIDKGQRTEGLNWWRQEEWGYIETSKVLEEVAGGEFDYVLSHTAPREAYDVLKKHGIDLADYNDSTVNLNSAIFGRVAMKHWYFGHYHVNFDDGLFSCLYKRLSFI